MRGKSGGTGAIIGGISGAITAGIGAEFGVVGGNATTLGGKILNEIERAGTHALAQGVFSVVRGGNFWQGAAAGAVSSLGGSAFQAFCPPDIATSFVGVTAFSAVMGGAGAYLGGARSPEEILMGVAAGAMRGALNDGIHLLRSKNNDPDEVKSTNRIRTIVGHSKTVQAVENSLFNDDGAGNRVLQVFDKLEIKGAGVILKIIDGVKIMVDDIAPITNKWFDEEYYYFQNNPVPQTFKIHGVMLDKNGNYINY